MRTPPILVMLFLLLSGCGSSATSVATPSSAAIQHGSINVGGLTRTYRLFRPPSLESQHPAPLVLLLHACGSSGDKFALLTQFDDPAAKAGFVAAYPDALTNFGDLGLCWNEFLDSTKTDDFGFIGQLIDRLAAKFPIDKNRIFVTGLQSGGHMAYTLAYAMPERLTGIASVAGGMPIDDRKATSRCSSNQTRPVSVLEMHGTADSFVPYEGGGFLNAPPTLEIAKYWAKVDGCSGDPVVSRSGIIITSLWKQCKGATVVRLDTVTGGHNTWFGSTLDPVPSEPNANAVVADFFSSLQPTA